MKTRIIPVFIPHSGCPFQCLYCDQQKQTGRKLLSDIQSLDIRSAAQRFLSTIPDDIKHVEIGFFGGTFTGLDAEAQEFLLSQAEKLMKDHPRIKGIRISTHPLLTGPSALSLLKSFPVTVIELGIQSLNDRVLQLSGRGYDKAAALASFRLIKEARFKAGIQLMTGLPGESGDEPMESARIAAEAGPDFVRIYPCIVFRGTPLERMAEEKTFMPDSLDQAVEKVSRMLLLFRLKGIPVIRAGIHPVSDRESITAGPYHPSFRRLCEERLRLDLMRIVMEKGIRRAVFFLSQREEAFFRGSANSNITKLIKEFPSAEILIKPHSGGDFMEADDVRTELPWQELFSLIC